MKRGVWIVGAAVAAVVAVVLMLGEPDVPSADASGPGVVREPARPVAGVAVERVEVVDAKADAVVGAEGVAPDKEEEAPRHPASWAPMLARLRGIAWFAGAPRGDLSVEWLDSSNVPRRSTTAPDGSFVIEGLLPGDGGVLWIDRRGPNATKREVTLPPVRGADRDLGIVRLDARGTVTGRVVDGNGRPIAEAWIRAFAPNELEGGAAPPRPVAHVDVWRFGPGEPWGVERLGEDATDDPSIGRPSTRSAEDGTFRISGPLRHDDRLVVQHSDHRPATIGPFGVRFDRASDAGDVVLGEGRVVRGAVVDAAGAPAADVELFVGRLESVFGRQEDVDTDEAVATARRGKLRLAAVTDGRGRFTARGCDDDADAIAARSRDGGAWIVLHPIPDGELTLRLVERAELRLTVTDEHGAPIRGARAEAMPTEYGGSLEAFRHPEASEADGAGRIVLRGLRPGSHQVTVTSPGHVDRTLEVDLPTSGATEVPVRLESGLMLRIRVVDGSGVPISDARLTCVEATDWSDIDTRTLLSYSFRLPESHSSSEDGDVTLHGLAAGKHTLNVSHPAYTARELEVELPLDSEAMEVVLGAGGRIVCRPDEHLPPLPHPRRVQLRGPIWCAIETDGRGGFVVEGLAPGEYALHLWNDEEGWSMPERGRSPFDMHTTAETVEARVEEGETTYVTFLTFSDPPAAPGRVHGRVVVDGAPAAGWTVELDARDAGIRGARRVTDHAGRFDYPRVAPGRVQVSVPQPDIPAIVFPFDLAGRSVRLAPGAEEFVELSFFTGRAEGRVLDAATGAPVVGAEVSFFSRAAEGDDPTIGGRIGTVTDHDGRFELAPVVAGTHHLEVEAAGFMAYEHATPVVVPIGDGPPPIDVRLTPGAVVRGRVSLAPRDAALRLFFLRLYDHRHDDDPKRADHQRQYYSDLDEDGSFEITSVIPGDYHAKVIVTNPAPVIVNGETVDAHREYEADPIDVVVPPGGIDGVELRPEIRALPLKVPFAGRIELPPDVPQAVTELFLRPTDDPEAEFRLDVQADRSFSGHLPAGEYQLWVLPSWRSVAPEVVTVPEAGRKGAHYRLRKAPEESAGDGGR